MTPLPKENMLTIHQSSLYNIFKKKLRLNFIQKEPGVNQKGQLGLKEQLIMIIYVLGPIIDRRDLLKDQRVYQSVDSKMSYPMKSNPLQNHFEQMITSFSPHAPKQMAYQQQYQASNFISPFASYGPIMNSQSFDPFALNNRKDVIHSSMERLVNNAIMYDVQQQKNIMANNNTFSKSSISLNGLLRGAQIGHFVTEKKTEQKVVPKFSLNNIKLTLNQVMKQEEDEQKPQRKLNQGVKLSMETDPGLEDSEYEQAEPAFRQARLKRNKSGKRYDDQSDSFKLNSKRKPTKLNDTKNITKNFSKAIISYIVQNKDIGLRILDNDVILYEEFITLLKSKKNHMTNIKQLRDLWTDTTDDVKQSQFNKAFRIISKFFLQKQSVSYIYNSRISNAGWHLKYRTNLIRALKEPDNFKYIKEI